MAWSWDGATLDVQMGFGSPPATAIASITWTTITSYVRSLSFGNGKSDELDSYQAGRLSMVLANADRRFDPLHTTGPYYPNLKPMTPCRVLLTYGGTTTTMWTGFVSGWPQAYDPPNDATVNVTATDGFAVLQRTRMPSLYAAEVSADSPSLWWRLGERAGSTAVDASGNNYDGVYIGGATFNSRTGLIDDADNAIGFVSGQSAVRSGFPWPAFPFSIEVWFATTEVTLNDVFEAYAGQRIIDVQIQLSAGTIFAGAHDGGSGQLSRSSTATTYNDGATHHVVATWVDASTAPTLYIDGVSDAGSPIAVGTPLAAIGTTSVVVAGTRPSISAFIGTIDEVVVYPSALSAGRVTAHYNAGHAPLSGLDTGAAITKVLDIIGWPSADRTIETGKSTVVAFDMGGKTALATLQDLEKTEQGRFFIAPDGKATFYNRHHTITTAASTASQATFGDSGGELLYGDLSTEYSEDKIRNSITTARVNGSPYLVEDAASIVSYREREFSLTGLYNSSDNELRDLGLWLLGHYAQPVTRVPAIVIQPRAAPTSLFPQIRDRDLCDRVTIKRRPQNVGTAISLAVLIEGVQHNLTPDDWTTTLTLSPAEATGFFILDDATLGRLGLNALAF